MSHRVSITLDDHTYQALLHLAQARSLRPTTLAGQTISNAISGPSGPSRPPCFQSEQREPATAPQAPAVERAPSGDGRAAWLARDQDDECKHETWQAAEQLRHWYPDLDERLHDGWHTDRFTRDGTLALAQWRTNLDTRALADPIREHEWLRALHAFVRMLQDRQGILGTEVPEHDRPGLATKLVQVLWDCW